jgi:hypothetical protein
VADIMAITEISPGRQQQSVAGDPGIEPWIVRKRLVDEVEAGRRTYGAQVYQDGLEQQVRRHCVCRTGSQHDRVRRHSRQAVSRELIQKQLQHTRIGCLEGWDGEHHDVHALNCLHGLDDRGVAQFQKRRSEFDKIEGEIGVRSGQLACHQDTRVQGSGFRLGISNHHGGFHTRFSMTLTADVCAIPP